jgi:predicted transport protein
MLFKLKEGKAKRVKENDFKLERDIQKLVEENMNEILNLDFITTEFAINNFRIDSLAFDKESNAFIIVEYKRGRNESLIDQGYTYLYILFDRKADFVLKYNEVKNTNLKISDIEWEQSRVIFVSPKFTDYQIKANDFKNNPIELVQIAKYEDGIIEIDRIKKNSNIKLETNTFGDENNFIDNVDKQIRVYNEEDHLSQKAEGIKELYYQIKDRIMELDNIEIQPKKLNIAFKGIKTIADVEIRSKDVKIVINLKKGELDDPKNLSKDVSEIGHWGNGDYELKLTNDDDIDYVMSLIKQSWKKHKK